MQVDYLFCLSSPPPFFYCLLFVVTYFIFSIIIINLRLSLYTAEIPKEGASEKSEMQTDLLYV